MNFNPSHICNKALDFPRLFREILQFQRDENPVYSSFFSNLELKSSPWHDLTAATVPMLPVEAFRDATVYAASQHPPEITFRSSGTTGMVRSVHQVAYAAQYEAAIFAGIAMGYRLQDMVVLGYTPGYNENPNSSLVWMLDALVRADSSRLSRFLPVGEPIDPALLQRITAAGKRVLLFGAAFGLADLSERHPLRLPPGSIIMETGGMKTWRREMSRESLHRLLSDGFGVSMAHVHSEYGMTELLSQAYSAGDYWFVPPPWMRVSIRDPFSPLREVRNGQEGLIGVVDLANWASCPFLLTGDRGVCRADGAFQVLGRWSSFHLRGCNFLLEDE